MLFYCILYSTAGEAETDPSPTGSRTEAKAVEKRTGAGRKTDTTRVIETKTDNVAKTATESTR